MFITKEKAQKEIELAKVRASKIAPSQGSPFVGKHIVVIGAPGSMKVSTINALLYIASRLDVYEKARSVTDRPRRSYDAENDEYIFSSDSLKKNVFLNFILTVYRKMIATLQVLLYQHVELTDGHPQVIRDTVYSIGNNSYGISLGELTRIIARGKKFIAVCGVEGAVAMKKIFGDDVMVVYLNVSREQRATNLSYKYHHFFQCKKSTQEGLIFGDKEEMRIKRQVAFPIVSIKPENNPMETAEQILLEAELKAISKNRIVATT